MTLFRFGDFEADESRFELRRCGAPVRVQRIVLATIFFLLRSRGRVVSKRDLTHGPWKGVRVSEAAVSRAIMLARRAISDSDGSIILTVHGMGYRFASEIALLETTISSSDERTSLEASRSSEAPAMSYADGRTVQTCWPSLSGRASELAALRTAFDAARAGHGRLLVLAGEAGVGKTALIEYFALELARQGTPVAWGRSWHADAAPALWPWLEVVRSCLSGLERADESDPIPGDLVPMIQKLGWGPHRPRSASDKDGQLHMFDSVVRFLREVSRARPLVVLLEDIHHADETSVLLLDFLRHHIGDMSLLVVATRRPILVDGPLRYQLDEAGAHVQTLSLSGLSTAAVKSFLRALGHPCSERLADAVSRATAGNPLLVRALATSPAITAFETGLDAWKDHLVVPEHVAAILRTRITELRSENTRGLRGGNHDRGAPSSRGSDERFLVRLALAPEPRRSSAT